MSYESQGPQQGPFHVETATLYAENDAMLPGDTSREGRLNIGRLNRVVASLEEDCPYVGEPVVVVVDEPVVLVDVETGLSSVTTGEIAGVLDKLYLFAPDDTLDNFDIGLELRLHSKGSQQGPQKIAMIDVQDVLDIQLQEHKHLFDLEETRLREFTTSLRGKLWERAARDQVVQDDAIEELVEGHIEQQVTPQSLMVGAQVELVVCESVEVGLLVADELSPVIRGYAARSLDAAIDQADMVVSEYLDDDEEEDDDKTLPANSDSLVPDDPSQLIENIGSLPFRGKIRARVVDFDYLWGDPYSEDAKLAVVVELPQDHKLVLQSGGKRYAAVLTEDISHGRIINGGPAFN